MNETLTVQRTTQDVTDAAAAFLNTLCYDNLAVAHQPGVMKGVGV
jgi:hypothetical protein